MVRGWFIDISHEELNLIKAIDDLVDTLIAARGRTEKEWNDFVENNPGIYEVARNKDKDWHGSPLYESYWLRSQAVNAGFKIEKIYPIFYQDSEMDEWGLIGVKDGKKYILETELGILKEPREIKSFEKNEMSVLNIEFPVEKLL